MVAVVAVNEGMEASVEEVGAAPAGQNIDISAVAKGKRTKRQRPHSPPIPFTITPPQETAASASASASSEESTTTEEVNTARWLILLSQGHFDRRYDEAATTSYGGATRAAGNSGACVYTCKTCNRSFSSFQALGGHRASHKKPKNEKKVTIFYDEEDFPSPNSLSLQLSSGSTATFSIAKSSPSPRIHVCSHCGAEFTSGQALGGHMRKHRGAGPMIRSFNIPPEASVDELEPEPEPEESDKLAIGLTLDLNMPAPIDDKEKRPKET